MSARLLLQTCLNHPVREAVGRCLECTRFFCRECIAEHDGRLICGQCLARLTKPTPTAASPGWRLARSLAVAVLGFATAWFCFYTVGEVLLALPSSWHQEAIWESLGLPPL